MGHFIWLCYKETISLVTEDFAISEDVITLIYKPSKYQIKVSLKIKPL